MGRSVKYDDGNTDDWIAVERSKPQPTSDDRADAMIGNTDGAKMTAKQREALVQYLRYLVHGWEVEGDGPQDAQTARVIFEWEWPQLAEDVFRKQN